MPKKNKNNGFSELYQVMAEEAIMGFITFDIKSGQCVYANRLAKELLQINNDELLKGLTIDCFYPDSQKTNIDSRAFNEDMLNNEGFYQDILVSKSTNVNFIANLGIRKITLKKEHFLLLMLQDITIQKRLQREVQAKQAEIKNTFEELVQQNEQLKQLDVAKNRFIALTTHELRTPLSAVIASSEVLKLKMYDSEEQMNEFVDMIYDEGHQLMGLINDILDFAKIQAGKMDFYVKQHNVVDLVNSQVEALQTMAEANKVDLKFEQPIKGAAFFCFYDDMRLKQIVANIINNAIKYNNEGGWVKVTIKAEGKFTRVIVEDNGKGISEDQLTNVFNEFETLGKVALHHQGTGLGMPISKRLIEGMGGVIDLKSQEGKGTNFWIDIPNEKVLDEDCYRDRPDSVDLAA